MALPEHSHAFLHAHAGVHALPDVRHRADHGGHVVHHVVRQVAVHEPVARIDSLELDIAGLGDTNQHRVRRSPG